MKGGALLLRKGQGEEKGARGGKKDREKGGE